MVFETMGRRDCADALETMARVPKKLVNKMCPVVPAVALH